jgi:capsular exopolysaccharide synthesis family protein
VSVDIPEDAQSLTRVREFLRVLRKHWYIVILAALVGGAASYLWALMQPERYQADVTAFVTTSNSSDLNTQLIADNFLKSKSTQYADLAGSKEVAAAAVKKAGLQMTPDQALSHFSVTVPKDTPQLKISVQAPRGEDAAKLADAWVSALNEQLKGVEGTTNNSQTTQHATGALSGATIQIRQYAQAQIPGWPAYPNRKLAIAVGTIIATGLALASLYVQSLLDRRVRSAAVLHDRMGLTVVGTVPQENILSDGRRLAVGDEDTSTEVTFRARESFKELRTNLRFMHPDDPLRIFTITSSLPSEGKSTVASNLAIALAQEGQPTILLDGDLRRPSVATTFGIMGNVGVCDVVVGDVDVEDVIQEVEQFPDLRILAAGKIPPNPSEILSSERFEALVRGLAKNHMVVIDAPPLLAVTDAAILAARFQGAVVVVSAMSSKLDELQQSLRNLRKIHAPVIGAVLNRVPRKGGAARAYYYYGKDYYYTGENGPVLERSPWKRALRKVESWIPFRKTARS